jgi:peptidoglycan/LPS O-acetylase OafA/YrhL
MPSGAAAAQIAPQGIKKAVFRPDIQGLRMVAVLAVIVDHLFHWPSGGFVGVDVFFVISGFLITGLLLREHDRTGTISFRGFYARRVKRILPAATAVVVATIAVSYLVFSQVRAETTLWDGIWATFFAANWHFALQGTDYFNVDFAISPLQHYWSLSVEEQFYLVWPWLMLLIFWLVGRRRSLNPRFAHRAIGLAMLLITAASFVWAVWDTTNNPTWAYFSTFTRAWELGLGALIAITASWYTRLPSLMRPVLGWLGLIGIFASFFVIDDANGGFPAPWAALPVVSTALVIVGGTGGEQRFLWPIMNPVSSWFGDVSYSLYVWHFPVIIIGAALLPAGLTYYLVSIGVILGLSTASYYLIENPVREWGTAPRKQRAPRGQRSLTPTGLAGLLTVGVVCLSLAAVALIPRTSSALVGEYQPPLVGANAPTDAEQPADAASMLTDEIRVAVSASSWPELSPSVDQLDSSWSPEWKTDGCLDVTPDRETRCTYGSGQAGVAVLLGDSVSVSWMPGIRAVLEPAGYVIHVLTYGQCPAAVVDVSGRGKDAGFAAECRAHNEWALQRIAELRPNLVIASNAANTLERIQVSDETVDRAGVYQSAFEGTLRAASSSGARVVVLPPNPRGKGLVDCYTALSSPSDCVTDPPSQYANTAAAMLAAAQAASATYIDNLSWFCASGRCPAFVASIPVTVDGTHLTAPYAAHLQPVLQDALLPPSAG